MTREEQIAVKLHGYSLDIELQSAFYDGATWADSNRWVSVEDIKPQTCIEVLFFHKDWIDEDFNPDGIKMGFLNDEGAYITSHWLDYQDCYVTHDDNAPSHWTSKPEPPKAEQ